MTGPSIRSVRADIDGWDCVAHESGPPDGPLVLALHGFPDTLRTFDRLREHPAMAGFRILAPGMRGIPPSSAAPDGDYSVERLAADVAGMARAFGDGPAHVIGHDWGAVAAYAAAALHPATIRRMVTVAVPPPAVFLRSLRPRQALRSWYMAFFQAPMLPERVVGGADGRFVEWLWRRWSPGWEPDRGALGAALDAYAAPGVARAALRYYRAIVPSLSRSGPARAAVLSPVRAPTLLVAGARDGCIGIEVMDRAATGFEGEWELLRLAGGHFAHLECGAEFAEATARWLGGAPRATP